MKRFESYFDDVMAGRRGNSFIGFGLVVLAASTGGAMVVLPVAILYGLVSAL